MSSGKRKRDEYPGQLPSGSFVPQQDGSADQIVEFVVSKVTISDKFNSLSDITFPWYITSKSPKTNKQKMELQQSGLNITMKMD